MKRSQLPFLPEYFDRYILLCDDGTINDAIQTSIDELDQIPLDLWDPLGETTYASGKWTIKDILQHLIDTERVFTYRALAFARNEIQLLPSFSENEYAGQADASRRSLTSLIAELRCLHQSTKAMFDSFTPEMLLKKGMGFKGEYTVASIGFIQPGHQRWHFEAIEKNYLPLLQTI